MSALAHLHWPRGSWTQADLTVLTAEAQLILIVTFGRGLLPWNPCGWNEELVFTRSPVSHKVDL